MGTQGHLVDLQRAVAKVQAHSIALFDVIHVAAASKDANDVRAVQAAMQNLMKDLGPLKQTIIDAEKHIKGWGSESRWKQAKNVAMPAVTKARKELEDDVRSAQGVVNQAHFTLKHYDELKSSMK